MFSLKPIALADARTRAPADVLQARGGFVWWYADGLDASGTGFVLIWSFGLPFVPERTIEPASRQPVLNLALYERGEPSFYLLQRLRPEEVSSKPGLLQMERSTIRTFFDGTTLSLRADLDLQVPGTRRRSLGRIELTGMVPSFDLPLDSPHVWSPIAPCASCTAEFDTGEAELRFEGLAYHDCNSSPIALAELGIARWTWGRLTSERGASIYYVVWPSRGEPIAYLIDARGSNQPVLFSRIDARLEEPGRARYGLQHPRRLSLFSEGRLVLDVRTVRVVDDGPFYLRAISKISAGEAQGLGFSEWVEPNRIDRPWQHRFVRMRVHDRRGGNSFLLPFFSGARRGRFSRLMGWAR
jgi:hypothetical protein